jgi:hypothetical protein
MTENTPPDREADDRGLTSEEWQDLVFACNYGAIEPGRGTVDCWASHPEVVIELHNVMTEFTRVYQMNHPPLAGAMILYDRWLPGMLRRCGEVMENCGPAGCVTTRHPYHQRQPGR